MLANKKFYFEILSANTFLDTLKYKNFEKLNFKVKKLTTGLGPFGF